MKLHTKIRKLMGKYGYAVSKKGVCAGIGRVGLHAILLRDTASFNHRLEILDASNKYSEEFIQYEMSPFFESIYLVTHPEALKKLNFHESPSELLHSAIPELITHDALKEKGGAVKIGQFSGMYNVDSLSLLLDEMAAKLNELPDSTSPVAIFLGSGTHIISLGYDVSTKQWAVIDANQLLADTTEVAKTIIAGFLAKYYAGVNNARKSVEESSDLTAAFSSQLVCLLFSMPMGSPTITMELAVLLANQEA